MLTADMFVYTICAENTPGAIPALIKESLTPTFLIKKDKRVVGQANQGIYRYNKQGPRYGRYYLLLGHTDTMSSVVYQALYDRDEGDSPLITNNQIWIRSADEFLTGERFIRVIDQSKIEQICAGSTNNSELVRICNKII